MLRGLGGSQMQRAGRCFAGRENMLLLKNCVDRRTVKQDPRARGRTPRSLFISLPHRAMGLFDKLFGRKKPAAAPARFDMDELSRRLGMDANLLVGLRPEYRRFTVPKRNSS